MKRALLSVALLLAATAATAQPPRYAVDTTRYAGYVYSFKPDWSLMRNVRATDTPTRARAKVRKAATYAVDGLPDHWNSAETQYFPPTFSQGGYGSCGVSSRVGYMMTHEMNAYNNTDATLLENQLTPMFQYPFTYHGPGKDQIAIYMGYPNAKIYGGRYESSIYGGSECSSSTWGWVQGYETFYDAMKRRISGTANFPQGTNTLAGAEAVKRWLLNHNDDPDFEGRPAVCGIGCGAGGLGTGKIASTTANDAAGVTGKYYITHWNVGTNKDTDGGVDHAMTLVGYDDRIEFDLDGNGVYGEESNAMGQNETGAWIVCNSWGATWCNNGLAYLPYALQGSTSRWTYRCDMATPVKGDSTKVYYSNNGGFWPEVYYWRKDYTPERTMKVTMSYSKRSEISVKAGISADTTATAPTDTYQFVYINYTGDGDGDSEDAETPLLGTWADGKVHTESMEFGIDLTDLEADYDLSKPLKYFLVIDSKSSASGEGTVADASVIDYALNAAGIETPFKDTNVTIKTAGEQTVIGVVVHGTELPAPNNVALSGTTLSWTRDATSGRTPAYYIVLLNGTQVATTTETSYTVSEEGTYTVKAAYTLGSATKASSASESVTYQAPAAAATQNDIFTFDNSGFYVPNVGSQHDCFTLEYWMKPTKLASWNQRMGSTNWNGSQLHFLADANGGMQAGWNSNNHATAASGTLSVGTWCHIAIVVDSSTITLYKNGEQVATHTSSSTSGQPKWWDNRFYFGSNTGSNISADVDEVRIWSEARSQAEIQANYKYELPYPEQTENLLAYFKMDTVDDDGTTKLRDASGNGNHGVFIDSNQTAGTAADGATVTLNQASTTVSATISGSDEAYVGESTTYTVADPSDNVSAYAWTATGAEPAASNAKSATFNFTTVGEQTVSLTASCGLNNASATVTKTVNVLAGVTPTAYFTLSSESANGSDRISFVSANQASGCTYSWAMPDADEESATTPNASASYATTGEKTVTLTVTDRSGTAYTYARTFQVQAVAPKLAYTLSPAIARVGENVTLTDESTYDPTSWDWNLYSSNARLTGTTKTLAFKPTKAGVYTLVHSAANEAGTSTETVERALIVCKTRSYQGLGFTQGRDVELTLPEAMGTAWTLEYWYKPGALATGSQLMTGTGADGSAFTLTADGQGKVSLAVGGETFTTDASFYVKNEWHHYAYTFSGGALKFYRDGVQMKSFTATTTDFTNYFLNFTLGSTDASGSDGLTGMMDEFRIWNQCRSLDSLRANCTQPITDLTTAEANGLQVYYGFNQSGVENVTDATSHGVTGDRSHSSGLLGDAWGDSEGVFALSFDEPDDLTAGMTQLDRSSYRITAVSDEEVTKETAPADFAFDGNTSTIWHSCYSTSTGYPHSITLKRANGDEITGIKLVNRNDNSTYRPADITVEQSADGETWETVADAEPLFDTATPTLALGKSITEKYIRLSFSASQTGSIYLALAEIYFYGNAVSAEKEAATLSYVACSDEETSKETAPASYAVDGKTSTFWHSCYNTSTSYPHSITLKNDGEASITMLQLVQRLNMDNYKNYHAMRLNIYTSDDGETFTELATDVRIPMSTGSTATTSLIELDQPITTPYFKLEFTRNQYYGTGGFLGMAEITAYGASDSTHVAYRIFQADGTQIYSYAPGDAVAIGTTISADDLPDAITGDYISYPAFESVEITNSPCHYVDLTYVPTTPFTISAAADTTWYNLKVKNHYIAYTYGKAGQLTTYPSATSNGRWAFFGNPFTGFRLVNACVPDSVAYAGSSPARDDALVMADGDEGTLWTISPSTNTSYTDAFSIQVPGKDLYWNSYDSYGQVKFWSSSASNDAGSNVQAEAVSTDDALFQSGFYYLKSKSNDAYLYVTDAAQLYTRSGTDAGSVFTLKVQPDGRVTLSGRGKYAAAQDERYNVVGTTDDEASAYHAMITKTPGGYYNIQAGNNVTNGIGKGIGYNYLFNDVTNSSRLVSWEASADAAQWTPEAVTEWSLSIANAVAGTYYATLCLPFDYTTPTGTTAQAITVEGTTAQATDLSSGVPAGTAVVITSDTAAPTLNVGAVSTTDDGGDLEGTFFDQNIEAKSVYTFSGGSAGDTPGFYVYTGTSLSAYKAWLPLTNSNIRAFLLDGSTLTAISGATTDEASDAQPDGSAANATYDLQGRRVAHTRRGIYIQKGKKVLLK